MKWEILVKLVECKYHLMFGLELAENELVYLLHDCPIGAITGGENHCRSSEKKAFHMDWLLMTLVL